ncbi:MAG: DUF2934 domain-containing protein [Myxococcota bacterium]|jgi:hypothetical protein|nr:DUF2934 domain-containing protein [Myxococcota bacterium]
MATAKTTKNATSKKTDTTRKPEPTKRTTAKSAPVKTAKAEAKPEPKPAPLTKKQTTPTAKMPPAQFAREQISHEMIAREAYLLWQSRGGCEEENWLEAERNVRSRNGRH